MLAHQPFHYHSLDDLARDIERLALDIPLREDLSPLAEPLDCGAFRLPNRFVVLPMEGCDGTADGAPDELTFRRYRRFAAGGAGLLWVEACAVVHEGRANPRQLWIRRSNTAAFARMLDEARRAAAEIMGPAHRPVFILQLTHSGRYSKPGRKPAPVIAHHSKYLDPAMGLPPDYLLIADEELERLEDAYVEAARCARDAGFDGVDVKACHRYLVSELHASFTRENSRYGGPEFENRTRFFHNVVEKIRDAVPGIAVTTRMNAYDAMPYPYGWGMAADGTDRPDLAEPLRLVGWLAALGAPLVNITIGNPYYNPHVNRPFDLPVAGAPLPQEHPLEGVARFLHIVRQVQQAHPSLPVVGGGYSWLRQFFPYVAAAAVARAGSRSWAAAGWHSPTRTFPASCSKAAGWIPPESASPARPAPRSCATEDAPAASRATPPSTSPSTRPAAPRRSTPSAGKPLPAASATTPPACRSARPASTSRDSFRQSSKAASATPMKQFARQMFWPPSAATSAPPKPCANRPASMNTTPSRCRSAISSAGCRAWRSKKAGAASRRPRPGPTGCRVAIVGAGPAGVAAAVTLASHGHQVVLLDRNAEPGGVARGTIPPDRLPDEILRQELEDALLASGCVERRVFELGLNNSLDSLLGEGFDAVLLTIGLTRSVELESSQRPAGVCGALEFLRRVKHEGARADGAVAVIGGGNTAIDAALSAVRAGAQDVSSRLQALLCRDARLARGADATLRAGVHFSS